MDNFTKELNKLLDKYPELGSFTIQVRPRITIVAPQPAAPAANMKPAETAKAQEPGEVKEVPKVALEGVLAMENTVKSRIAGMKKASVE